MASPIQTKIISHHVGGRGFEVALKIPLRFRSDIIHVLYEADEECATDMKRTNMREELHIAPYCLGASDSDGILNIMANPYFSSLLEPDPAFQASSCEVVLSGRVDDVPVGDARYDALYATENRIVRQVPVKIRSLDSLRENQELPINAVPDFFSLDTQGTEFDVLQGAKETINSGVLAFATEVEFRPMYKGQRLFSSIFDFALENGFEFAGFTYLQGVAPGHMQIGLRARDELAFGDAVFFRKIDWIERAAPSADDAFVMALKLAFIAISFGYLGTAITALRMAFRTTPPNALRAELSQRPYFQFLERFFQAAQKTPACYLHTDRYALAAEINSSSPMHRFSLRSKRNARAGEPAFLPTNEIEGILRAHDFTDVARLTRRRRKEAERYILGAVRHIEKTHFLNLLRKAYRISNLLLFNLPQKIYHALRT